MTPLIRTVPFLVNTSVESRIMLDRFDFPSRSLGPDDPVVDKIGSSLTLHEFGDTIDAEAAIAIASEQYAAGAEFVYSHPIWNDIREGSQEAVYAYLLETRHYLAAASSRMSPGIHGGLGLAPLTLLLSKHLTEEYDHAKFFEEALQILGCPGDQIIWARPIPSTLEWIHFTRAVAKRDSLSAALCSGFMEYSSRESEAVVGWHDHLVKEGLLSAEANAAIFRHVETDVGFGHDKNWEYALQYESPILIRRYADALNDVTNLCEMIYRWLSSLRDGISSLIVTAMCAGAVPETFGEKKKAISKVFNGLPVWPSSILASVNRGRNSESSLVMTAIGIAYSHGPGNGSTKRTDFEKAVDSVHKSFTAPKIDQPPTSEGLYRLACSWLRAIDGHDLWDAMVDTQSFPLVQGYLLENYHYLASATHHISAAISSCPDNLIQLELIAHLEDELEHCELLRDPLEQTEGISRVENCRPLPTTIAFVDYLRDLAVTDWRGYLIASAFLQSSLAEGRPERRPSLFYSKVIKNIPKAKALLDLLQRHDDIDEKLGHDNRAPRRLELLVSRHEVPSESLDRAAMTPLLAWSFLDGILQHYKYGVASVIQRVGWKAK
jgi:pyrroloquinoline quinone (PQQ) biosynthesis protein C